MATCEKCWRDAGGNPDRYREFLEMRTGDDECTPEQQAGEMAGFCPVCDRQTVHQHVLRCMVPGCDYTQREELA